MQGRFVAYYRVSTAEQGTRGLDLDEQRKAVTDHLNGGNWTLLGEFTETESSKTAARPQLALAMAQCKLVDAMLVVAKLDRLSRDVAFLATLTNGEVPFTTCDNPHATPFTIHFLAAVAQHERQAISTRTKVALAAAKARGQTLGGYRGAPAPDGRLGTAVRQAGAQAFADRLLPLISSLHAKGLSLRQIADRLTEMGILTPRRGIWTATAVKRVLDRQAN